MSSVPGFRFVASHAHILSGRRPLFLAALVAFLAAFGVAAVARAQDSVGKFGTRYACLPLTVTTSWTGTAIAGLKDQTSGSAASGTTWSSVWVWNTHATNNLFVCLNAAAGCPVTTNIPPVPAGGVRELGTIGVVTSAGSPFASVSLQGSGAGTTAWLCGHVR